MSVRINNIKLTLDEDIKELEARAAKLLKIETSGIKNFRILKESIDARKKDNICFVYNVTFDVENEKKLKAKTSSRDVIFESAAEAVKQEFGTEKLNARPVIIGAGPAGLFAGLVMAKNGFRPVIYERGDSIDARDRKIDAFWKGGDLDTESNIQFGEGGAGTYSDGKLTTRIKDLRCDIVLNEFVNAGAPKDIIYSGKPHIGTDVLKTVIKNIRSSIIAMGGEIHFNSKMTDIRTKNGAVTGIEINGNELTEAQAVIIAAGHSARDTYSMLFDRGVMFEQKAFAVGVRGEHLQSMIDENQYGKFAGHPKLKGADYRLTYTSESLGRPCYSFCMCPGGYVVAASSENERLVVNGMSEHKRDEKNANSALVVGVGPDDFGSKHPLAGIEFQRKFESLAFIEGGRNYKAPVQLVGDFIKDKKSNRIGNIEPSHTSGWEFGEIKNCLPDYVVKVLKEGLVNFDRKIHGFASYDAILTGIETRTSSPVRILRNEALQSISLEGLYPAGEGAGYAGGIVSAAVDGIKAAERIMSRFCPF